MEPVTSTSHTVHNNQETDRATWGRFYDQIAGTLRTAQGLSGRGGATFWGSLIEAMGMGEGIQANPSIATLLYYHMTKTWVDNVTKTEIETAGLKMTTHDLSQAINQTIEDLKNLRDGTFKPPVKPQPQSGGYSGYGNCTLV